MLLEAITPTEPSSTFLALRFYLAQLTWLLTEKAFNVEKIDTASKENIAEANELLDTHSLVVYANHRAKKDALLAISLVLKYLPNAHNYIGPAGLKHFDISRDKASAIAFKLVRFLHVYALPVFQHNDKEKARYSSEELAFITTQLTLLSQQLLGQPHMVYGITPEGTRNKDGVLTQARTGIGRLEQYHTPEETYYMPIGLIYPPHAQKNTIVVGKPILLPEVVDFSRLPNPELEANSRQRARTITDNLMHYLAKQLPVPMQGFYAE